MPTLDVFAQDLRHAWRSVRKTPSYSAVVVVTLALGIAANTVIFSVMNPYLLRRLPFAAPDALVQIGQVDPRTGWDGARFSLAMIRDYRERSRAFAALAAYHYDRVTLTDEERPARVTRSAVSANLFAVLGVEAHRGRTFLPGEDGPSGADVVVLDHGLWQTRYGGDPDMLGRTVRLDGVPHTVVGIMPPDFVFPWNEVKLWTPLRVDPATEPREQTAHLMVGRLAQGWSAAAARAELEGIQRQLAAAYPDADGGFTGISVRPLRAALNFAWDALSVGFPILLAAVAFVLLIVCVNVASLTLARGAARQAAVAVRAALGAGRGRLIAQLLTESGLLALAGGALGLGIAYWATAALGPAMPDALYRVGEVTLDGRVLAYSAAISLATPILFGLLPAFQASRIDPAAILASGGRGTGGAGTQRGRRALVVAEVALAIVLVVGAGLMLRSLAAVLHTDLGFVPDRLLTGEVEAPAKSYPTAEAVAAYYDTATAELAALPGVESVGMVAQLPMNHEMAVEGFALDGHQPPSQKEWPLAGTTRVSPGYFATLGVPLRAGRTFRRGDGDAVVVVSESLARRTLGAGDPIGATLLLEDRGAAERVEIVGVVAEVRQADLLFDNRPQLYRPLTGATARRRFLVLRTAGAPGALIPPVRDRLATVDPDLPVTLRPMSEVLRENTFVWSIGSLVLGAFGLFALFLASLGIYGVIAYAVARRRREMGIRMALGATAERLRRMVVGEGLRLAAVGLGIGLVLAAVAGRLMEAILFGVGGLDPLALGAALAVLLAVAAVSSWLPAHRAARTEPAEALRES